MKIIWFNHSWADAVAAFKENLEIQSVELGEEVVKERKRAKFVKAHAICGTATHIVTDLLVNSRGDATQFKPLLDRTAARFTVAEVSGDKAYLSKKNLEAAASVGAVPYIPFKEDMTGKGPALMAIFEKVVTAYRCERCGHEWIPRKEGTPLPTVCPKCKSPYWNKPRTQQSPSGEQK